MASVNKVILVGNLGRDPEIRSSTTSTNVFATLSIATTDTYVNRQTGQREDTTEWHKVIFNGKQAEVCERYLKKGAQVYIEGSIRTRKWKDKQTGQDRFSTEIRGDRLQMLGSSRSSTHASDEQPNGNSSEFSPAQRRDYSDFDMNDLSQEVPV